MNVIGRGLASGLAIALIAAGGAATATAAGTDATDAAGATATDAATATARAAAGKRKATVLDHSRAIPTKSRRFARIMVFTRNAKRVRISVDGGPRRTMAKLGRACTGGSCQRWRVYARRSGKECYAIEVIAIGRSAARSKARFDVCEPFGQGRL